MSATIYALFLALLVCAVVDGAANTDDIVQELELRHEGVGKAHKTHESAAPSEAESEWEKVTEMEMDQQASEHKSHDTSLSQQSSSSVTSARHHRINRDVSHHGDAKARRSTHSTLRVPLVKLKLGRGRSTTLRLLQEHMTLGMPGGKDTTKFFHKNDDMFAMTRQWDISGLPPSHITEFKPIVTKKKGLDFDGSIVHHMDLLLCTSEVTRKYPVVTNSLPHMMGPGFCDVMPWAYDRGGKSLKLPPHVGVRIGRGTPYTRILIEWHYLLPRSGRKGLQLLQKKGSFSDHSGIQLKVTPHLRKYDAGAFGMMDERMSLPTGKRRYHYAFTSNKDSLSTVLSHDFKKYGKLTPVAVHLHTHDHGRKVWWSHYRGGKKLGEFGRINKYGGYGKDESWFNLRQSKAGFKGFKGRKGFEGRKGRKQRFDSLMQGHMHRHMQADESDFSLTPGDQLKAGDQLKVNCVFDTRCAFATPQRLGKGCRKVTKNIKYGLHHGKEMCGFLMLYYPHDYRKRYRHGSYIGTRRAPVTPERPDMDGDDPGAQGSFYGDAMDSMVAMDSP